MNARRVLVGVGNPFRSDDGVGIAVAEQVTRCAPPDLHVVTGTGEPGAMLDAWQGAALAVVVDAAVGPDPGRIRRWTPKDTAQPTAVSSHSLGLAQTYALGEALRRLPDRLVVLTVDIFTADHGIGLSPAVSAALPALVAAVHREFGLWPADVSAR